MITDTIHYGTRTPRSTSRWSGCRNVSQCRSISSGSKWVDRLECCDLPLTPNTGLQPHLNWRGAKPVIRSSVCGFVNCVLLVDDRVLKAFGNAAFLVLVCEPVAWEFGNDNASPD